MRNLKKILALVLALMMTVSLMVVASAASDGGYQDDADISAEYAEAVEVLTGMGIVQGDEGGFRPQHSITRAEVSTIVYKAFTGDADAANVAIYEDYSEFTDVSADAWYAGYVNCAANQKWVIGVGDDKFEPESPVTGYEMLAILLRGIGYDKNNEFANSEDWRITVASLAEQLGLSNVLNNPNLNSPATREEVAALTFKAIQLAKVEYTPAFGYQPIKIEVDDTNDSLKFTTTSIGWEKYGLDEYEGYVVGNQATGEKKTLVATDYTPAKGDTTYTLNSDTELGLFGHQVSGWYCAQTAPGATKGDVFTTNDHSTSQVLTDSEYWALPASVRNDVDAKSVAYADFQDGTLEQAWAYNDLITNADGTSAIIRLDVQVAQYQARNDYTTTKTVTLNTGKVDQTNISGYEELSLGTYVNVMNVTGTNAANEAFPHKYISALDTTSGTLTYVNAQTGAITIDTEISKAPDSQITYATNAGLETPPATNAWNWNATYLVYTNQYGDFVSAEEISNVNYLKATYAYYETDVAGGELTYYVQGVDMGGQVRTVELAITATEYNALTCTKLNWGNSNAITAGAAQDLVLAPAANDTYTIAHRVTDGNGCKNPTDVVENAGLTTIGKITGFQGDASVSANTIALGTSGSNNWFVDANTTFYYVTGYGATVKVNTFAGLTALLNGNASCNLPENAVVEYTQIYSGNIASQNYHVDAVLIAGTPDLIPVSALVYVPTATVLGYNKVGENTYPVYDIYVDGVKYQVPVDASAVTGALTAETFYAYTVNNGVYVLDDATSGFENNYVLTHVPGTANLYVNSASGKQYPVSADAGIINLTTVENVPVTTAELMVAAENNDITVDAEIVNDTVVNLYIVGYTTA